MASLISDAVYKVSWTKITLNFIFVIYLLMHIDIDAYVQTLTLQICHVKDNSGI